MRKSVRLEGLVALLNRDLHKRHTMGRLGTATYYISPTDFVELGKEYATQVTSLRPTDNGAHHLVLSLGEGRVRLVSNPYLKPGQLMSDSLAVLGEGEADERPL